MTPQDQSLTETTTPLPSVDLQTFRYVMGSFASGVSVVTTLDDDRPRGFTCSAVCSVSADPPLLMASVSNRSGTLKAILSHGRFTVNILGAQARSVSQLFASPAQGQFEHVPWKPGAVTGMPLLPATVGYAECEVDNAVGAGDHTLLLGRMVGGGTRQVRGLAFPGQVSAVDFTRRFAASGVRRELRVGVGNPPPSEGVCDCTRTRCSG